MTLGNITLQGFNVELHNSEGAKVVDGKVTDEKLPLKIVRLIDLHSQLQVNLVFTPEQLDQFAGQLTQSRIVAPRGALGSLFTRNGRVRG